MVGTDVSRAADADAPSTPSTPSDPPATSAVAPDLRAVLDLALVEARRYGDDDSVWIRELVQNARDAGATRVTFRVVGDDAIVDDDGAGMSRAVITGQLLRLFSSSKAADTTAAGCFGVGFWSVLRASPGRIEVDSHDGRERTGLVIDVIRGDIVERTGRRQTRGTSIRLVGAGGGGGDGTVLRDAIIRHASMVDGRGDRPPAVVLLTDRGEERLNRPFSIDDVAGVVARDRIVGPGFHGFVGLSASPRVELFHHGLRVVEATSLSSLVPSLRQRPRQGLGLVVRVEVPGVKVLVDRRTVVEDDVVRALVAACDEAATRLERQVLDDAAPLPVLRRGLEAVGRFLVRPVVKAVVVGVVATGVGLGVGLAALGDERPAWATAWPWGIIDVAPIATTPSTISDVVARLGAPRIDTLGQTPAGFALATRHIDDDLLAIDVREIPDAVAGLRPRAPQPRAIGVLPSRPTTIVATAQLRGLGVTVLPSSLVVWPARAFVDGVEAPIGFTADGLPVVDVVGSTGDHATGRVVDVFYGLAGQRAPAAVPVLMNAALVPIVQAGGGMQDLDAVRNIGTAVGSAVRYSASAADARRFEDDDRPLIERALGLGFGDCDVINTVFVRALQQAGLPARLVRGLVVRHDAIATELHAWAEVFVDGAWHMVDASPPSAMPVPAIGPPVTSPGAPAPAGVTVTSPPVASTATRTPTRTPTRTSTSTSTSTSTPGPPATSPPAPAAAGSRLVRPAPAAHDDDTDWRDPVVATAAGVGLVAALGLVLLLARPRRRDDHRTDDVTDLLVAGLQSGAADHLGLLDRPIVPTSHGVISLSRARALAARGHLAMSRDGRPSSLLDRRVQILARQARRIVALGPWLPRVVDVDEFEHVLRSSGHDHERLAPLQQRVDAAFATVVLRPMSTPGLREVHLHTADGLTHQILVGPDLLALPPAVLWSRLLDEATSLWLLRGRA